MILQSYCVMYIDTLNDKYRKTPNVLLEMLSIRGTRSIYEPLKAEKERPTTHRSTERHLNLNHLTHLPKKERDVYPRCKLQC